MRCGCCVSDPTPLLVFWICVIVLVAVIGALSQTPPETFHQSFNYDSSKLQYIKIGGETKTVVNTNS
nr:MAG: hypothetical protein 3 [Tombusviridae sp.]